MEDRSRLPTIGPVIWHRAETAEVGIVHSELTLGDGYGMVVGPPRGKAVSPATFGGRSTQSVHVQLRDGLDAHCERARAAGARIEREPAAQPYGDRVYTCFDLEDHPWPFGQTVAAVSDADVELATGHRLRGKADAHG